MENHQGIVTEKGDMGHACVPRLRRSGFAQAGETPIWVYLLARQFFGGQELQRSNALRHAGMLARRSTRLCEATPPEALWKADVQTEAGSSAQARRCEDPESFTVSRDHPIAVSFFKARGNLTTPRRVNKIN
jgi:hypothetical protein